MSDDIDVRPAQVQTDEGLHLQGDLAIPATPRAVALVCHPHPQMGSDRRNTVVATLFEALPRAGVAVLRLDFRGVGRSEGSYGGGVDERLDAAAALDHLAYQLPDLPLWATGYSFGGDVALSVDHPALAGWVAVAPPLRVLAEAPPAAAAGRLTTLVVAAHDQFCPPDRAGAETAGWHDTTIVEVPMGDHFLTGRLGVVADLVIDALRPA